MEKTSPTQSKSSLKKFCKHALNDNAASSHLHSTKSTPSTSPSTVLGKPLIQCFGLVKAMLLSEQMSAVLANLLVSSIRCLEAQASVSLMLSNGQQCNLGLRGKLDCWESVIMQVSILSSTAQNLVTNRTEYRQSMASGCSEAKGSCGYHSLGRNE